jgi:hypothetical protein
MNGTRPKCPNLVEHFDGSFGPCAWDGYEIIDRHPFSEDSGLDPKAVLVRCKGCGCEYYVFPALSYREPAEVK